MDKITIKTAFISTTDKNGLENLVKSLHSFGVAIYSTGGTKQFIDKLGYATHDVRDLTRFPEMLDGRLKTLHPNVHGGLLAVRDNPKHIQAIKDNNIILIDLLVVNLYKFTDAVANGLSHDEIIENIDIGGPAMLRSAAKNHNFVAVLSNPNQYQDFIAYYHDNHGITDLALRQKLATDAFVNTAQYDAAVSSYFLSNFKNQPTAPLIDMAKSHALRYGENPHQKAVFVPTGNKAEGLANATILQGKEMSYNNYADASSAIKMVSEFDKPAMTIIKHADPCGVAIGVDAQTAYQRALHCDEISAFGGIIAANITIDEASAKLMAQSFYEVIIAPNFSEQALKVFSKKPNLRIIAYDFKQKISQKQNIKSVLGGVLIQDNDDIVLKLPDCQVITQNKPTAIEWHNLLFAWRVAKYARSNAVVIAQDDMAIGIGSGAVNRLLATKIAIDKAKIHLNANYPLVVASDAFFPFADSIESLVKFGVKAIIQPGGSIKDQEVIDACNKHAISMVFTHVRHFHH